MIIATNYSVFGPDQGRIRIIFEYSFSLLSSFILLSFEQTFKLSFTFLVKL